MAKKFKEHSMQDIDELMEVLGFTLNRPCPKCNKPMGLSLYEGRDDGETSASEMCHDCSMADML